MNLFSRFPAARWIAPAAAVALILGASAAVRGVVDSSRQAAAASLPAATAQQLVADIASARLTSMSGTVVESADLGLPDLPGLNTGSTGSGLAALTGGDTSWFSVITGSHTLRVWYDGQQRFRLALLGSMGESDLIRDGNDLWLWNSADNSVDHVAVSDSGPTTATSGSSVPLPSAIASGSASTPQQLAQLIIAAAGSTTAFSVGANDVVAGRSAYELVLTPKQHGTLVARVQIAIDGTTHIPLRVQVFSTQISDPAFQIGFSSVDFATPPAAEFTFSPPPGATVHQGLNALALAGRDGAGCAADSSGSGSSGSTGTTGTTRSGSTGPSDSSDRPKLVGSGWATVVVAATTGSDASGTAAPSNGSAATPPSGKGGPAVRTECRDASGSGLESGIGGLLERLLGAIPATSGSWGSGHVLSGTLFSAVLTDGGQLAIGAVPPATLYSALAAS